ncbi:MAG: hypothetical protein LUD72_08565 [Bacteroidales bacterium]|nr:hypothetical protein [Bacteroidales bacterium]
MDIYRFFNSKDVADYLKDINYEFTLPEAAFLVYQSEHRTLEEKFAAWGELIDTMPDCPVEERRNVRPMESFHQFLRDYMELQKKILRMFRESDGHIYRYEFYDTPYYREDKYFVDADAVFAHFSQNKEGYLEGGKQRMRFIRQALQGQPDLEETDNIWIEMTMDLDVMSVDTLNVLSDEEEALMEQFEGMFFMIPTPFKRGDILIDRSCYCRGPGPFVLDSISTWDRETLLQQGYAPQSRHVRSREEAIRFLQEYGDTTDMSYGGYFLDKEGEGFSMLYGENGATYLNLERYEEPLQGFDRVLKAVSSAMTVDPECGGPSLEPELLCGAYQLILTEEMCKVNRAFLEGCYLEEQKEQAGLK